MNVLDFLNFGFFFGLKLIIVLFNKSSYPEESVLKSKTDDGPKTKNLKDSSKTFIKYWDTLIAFVLEKTFHSKKKLVVTMVLLEVLPDKSAFF